MSYPKVSVDKRYQQGSTPSLFSFRSHLQQQWLKDATLDVYLNAYMHLLKVWVERIQTCTLTIVSWPLSQTHSPTLANVRKIVCLML